MRKLSRTRLWLWGVLACALTAGCQSASVPQIDPSGRRVFLPRGSTQTEPGPLLCKYDSAVTIAPRTIIAPVGSEVILVAGVCGFDGYLMAGERVEWMLAQGGVGEFVSQGDREAFVDTVQKVDPHFAIGATSRRYLTLTRGNLDPADDVPLLRGQAWISVTSPREGTSHVTAYAPEVYGWDRRKDTARIEWVDARWRLPPSAVNPAGTSHVFTTSVARRSDGTPIAGWAVRYSITGGPAAGFKPSGAQSIEVPTDPAGQASVELVQTTPVQGTNLIRVEVVRPANVVPGSTAPLVIGIGETRKTWSAPQIGLNKTGPTQGVVGATLTYRITVTNGGGAEAKGAVVTDQVPPGLSFISSNPPVQPAAGGQLSWNLGNVPAGQSRTIELNLKADQPGVMKNCAMVKTADGLSSQDCVTTTIGAAEPRLDLRIEGPSQVLVGGTAEFKVRITNTGAAVATGLLVKDTFDPGFKFDGVTGAVERSIENLAPGATKTLGIALRAVEPGRLCHVVEVTGEGSLKATAQACVTSVAAAVPQPQPQPEPRPEVRPEAPAKLSVRKTCQTTVASVGEIVTFDVVVRNDGTTPVKEYKIIDSYDLDFVKPEFVTGGHERITDETIAWIFTDIPPGDEKIVQIQARCLKATRRVCNPVTVQSGGVKAAAGEACLEIRAAAKLSISLVPLNNPVNVGQFPRFVVRLKNEGQSAARQISVTVGLPSEMSLQNVEQTNPTRHRVAGAQLTFEPFAELGPGELLEYRFTLRADRAATPRISVSASATGLGEPVRNSAEITVQAP
jgi:uncharacterized repeat protein (TIGR01451 family)